MVERKESPHHLLMKVFKFIQVAGPSSEDEDDYQVEVRECLQGNDSNVLR